MTVGWAETALDPLALDLSLESRDAAVKGFFLFCGDCGAGGAVSAATSVVSSSNGGKGRFNLREDFLDFNVLTGGGPSEMFERPLDDLVTLCCYGCQVVKMGVKIVGQVCSLGENAGFSMEWVRVGRGDNVVDYLGGGRQSERILSPR